MTTARRIEDPLPPGPRERIPIRSKNPVMEGSNVVGKRYVPVHKEPMIELFPEANRYGLSAGTERLFQLTRTRGKKKCASCNRGTRLQFRYGDLKWRRCRRDLTPDEKALLFLMLTEAEVGN